jgi:hypothetical protein
MSDSVKKWHEMKEDQKASRNHAKIISTRSFVWVLDHNYGTVHLYNITSDADGEACETLIELMGHNVDDCQWMLTENNKIYN